MKEIVAFFFFFVLPFIDTHPLMLQLWFVTQPVSKCGHGRRVEGLIIFSRRLSCSERLPPTMCVLIKERHAQTKLNGIRQIFPPFFPFHKATFEEVQRRQRTELPF